MATIHPFAYVLSIIRLIDQITMANIHPFAYVLYDVMFFIGLNAYAYLQCENHIIQHTVGLILLGWMNGLYWHITSHPRPPTPGFHQYSVHEDMFMHVCLFILIYIFGYCCGVDWTPLFDWVGWLMELVLSPLYGGCGPVLQWGARLTLMHMLWRWRLTLLFVLLFVILPIGSTVGAYSLVMTRFPKTYQLLCALGE
jgi:hypothetical protein